MLVPVEHEERRRSSVFAGETGFELGKRTVPGFRDVRRDIRSRCRLPNSEFHGGGVDFFKFRQSEPFETEGAVPDRIRGSEPMSSRLAIGSDDFRYAELAVNFRKVRTGDFEARNVSEFFVFESVSGFQSGFKEGVRGGLEVPFEIPFGRSDGRKIQRRRFREDRSSPVFASRRQFHRRLPSRYDEREFGARGDGFGKPQSTHEILPRLGKVRINGKSERTDHMVVHFLESGLSGPFESSDVQILGRSLSGMRSRRFDVVRGRNGNLTAKLRNLPNRKRRARTTPYDGRSGRLDCRWDFGFRLDFDHGRFGNLCPSGIFRQFGTAEKNPTRSGDGTQRKPAENGKARFRRFRRQLDGRRSRRGDRYGFYRRRYGSGRRIRRGGHRIRCCGNGNRCFGRRNGGILNGVRLFEHRLNLLFGQFARGVVNRLFRRQVTEFFHGGGYFTGRIAYGGRHGRVQFRKFVRLVQGYSSRQPFDSSCRLFDGHVSLGRMVSPDIRKDFVYIRGFRRQKRGNSRFRFGYGGIHRRRRRSGFRNGISSKNGQYRPDRNGRDLFDALENRCPATCGSQFVRKDVFFVTEEYFVDQGVELFSFASGLYGTEKPGERILPHFRSDDVKSGVRREISSNGRHGCPYRQSGAGNHRGSRRGGGGRSG